MAKFISKTQYVNNATKTYENNLNSIYARMLQSNPISVTYFHINNIESTTDSGFLDIQEAIGPKSPLRYMQVNSYPLFNFPTVQLDLLNDDQGLDVEFEGDAIHLPNTIKPYPNDLFIVDMIEKPCIFICTSVAYDTIKSHNYYKMSFSLRHISEDRIKQLYRQVTDIYTCVYENIGSEENWLISDDNKSILNDLLGGGSGNNSGDGFNHLGSSTKQGLIDKLKTIYKVAYYHERTNTFLYAYDYRNFIYDRYLNNFIYNSKIYYNAMSTDALVLVNEDVGLEFDYEYEESFYNAIEHRDVGLIKDEYLFRPLMITNKSSIFSFYDMDVAGLRMTFGTEEYLSKYLINCIKGRIPSYPDISTVDPDDPNKGDGNTGEDPDGPSSGNNNGCGCGKECCPCKCNESDYDPNDPLNWTDKYPEYTLPYKLISDYMNGLITGLHQLDIEALKKYNFKKYCFENYLLIPVIIYILTRYCKELS